MMTRNSIFFIILAISFATFFPPIYGESTISIIMEKTTYSYCEKLFYLIEVSEITGEPAIIHIRDEAGKGSSAIPIPITSLQNPVPSLSAFQEEIFPLGKYFIDVQYAGEKDTVEFNLIDSNKICIPDIIKPMVANWVSGNISDGVLMDAFQKYVDKEIVDVSFEINEKNIYKINIPDWIKNIGYWWMEGIIPDEEFAQVVNYIIDKKIITSSTELENEI